MVCFYFVNPLMCEPICISNLITGECMPLPRSQKVLEVPHMLGFGFSCRANEYKVIWIHTMLAEVCILGSGTWRCIGDVPDMVITDLLAVFLNGFIHWMAVGNGNMMICCFELESEQFKPLPLPSSSYEDKGVFCPTLGTIGGCLYTCYFENNVRHPNIDIWIMKDSGVRESWTKKFVIENPSWWPMESQWQEDVLLMKCGWLDFEKLIKFMENEKILVSSVGQPFVYHLKEGFFRRLRTYSELSIIKAIVHIPSFVLLKDIAMGGSSSILHVKQR